MRLETLKTPVLIMCNSLPSIMVKSPSASTTDKEIMSFKKSTTDYEHTVQPCPSPQIIELWEAVQSLKLSPAQ